ncbi:MAG TPA: hypothetical protein VLD17_04150 [Gemmatimonadaceae bacterium]|nr:hypothetical protein [Gemmatimonadaceae bacterium]
MKEVDERDRGEAPLEPREIIPGAHTSPVGIPIAPAHRIARLERECYYPN